MREFDKQMTADEHVAHGEIYFRSLIEHGSDIISTYDANAIRLYTSPSIEDVLGYKPAELIGKSGLDLVHRDDRAEMSRLFASVAQTPGRVMTRELRCHHKDGSWRVLEATARNLLDKSAVASIVLNSRDITDRKKAELRNYSHRLIEAQEKERHTIARELHDDIGQILTAVRINLDAIRRAQISDVACRIEESLAIIDKAFERVRELSFELRPSLLDDLGLRTALSWYLDRYSQRTGIDAELTSNFEDNIRLPRDLETACFRIAQEALANVARHAVATSVQVRLARSAEELILTVGDNGVGFDARQMLASVSSRWLGLHGMEERAIAVGGRCVIESKSGEGTKLVSKFPLASECQTD